MSNPGRVNSETELRENKIIELKHDEIIRKIENRFASKIEKDSSQTGSETGIGEL